MTSYGAVELWDANVRVPGSLHLTRRGRLVRAGLILLLVLMAALWALARFTAKPVRAEGAALTPVVSATRVTVREGDSLWAIARAAAPAADPREVVMTIRELNGLASNTIHPGQVLLVRPAG